MAVALCTKDHGVVFCFFVPSIPLSNWLHICCVALLYSSFPLSLFSRSPLIFFILPYFSRALLRTFGDMGERFGSMELDR